MLFVATIMRIVHQVFLASMRLYVSKRTGWVQKMVIFDDIQHCIYADIVGVKISKKKYADLI